jgi:hypothetical protein
VTFIGEGGGFSEGILPDGVDGMGASGVEGMI